jgi:FkbM family methyltransferase
MMLHDAMTMLIHFRDESARHPADGDQAFSFFSFCLSHVTQSRAQLLQDLFVLHHLGGRREGFFVEFGATNGVDLSNTFLLEKSYGWTGILAEPARCWHAQLRENRACSIDPRCVWSKTGDSLVFNEAPTAEFSTIDAFSDADLHARIRTSGSRYPVETVSLNDLLAGHDAPRTIDYLSLDTEGSELAILESFDFDRYDLRVITVEHNGTPARAAIHALLSRHGFTRKFERFSRWDDWYVKQL